jgi:hypothetical protein
MRVLKLTLGKNIFLQVFLQFQIFSVKHPDEPILTTKQEQSCHMLTLQCPSGRLSDTSGQDLYRFKTCFSFSAIHTSLHFYDVMLCVFLVDFSRDFGILCTSSHSMTFTVSSVILLSLCAFRILEYLLIGIFLCMKILFCLCVGLISIYLGHLDCDLCFCNSWASN